MQLQRNTCIKCGRQNNRPVVGDLSFHSAHVVPRYFCQDATHLELAAVYLCGGCHGELENLQKTLIENEHQHGLSHAAIERALVLLPFRWLAER